MTGAELKSRLEKIHNLLKSLVDDEKITQVESDASYPVILEMAIKNETVKTD